MTGLRDKSGKDLALVRPSSCRPTPEIALTGKIHLPSRPLDQGFCVWHLHTAPPDDALGSTLADQAMWDNFGPQARQGSPGHGGTNLTWGAYKLGLMVCRTCSRWTCSLEFPWPRPRSGSRREGQLPIKEPSEIIDQPAHCTSIIGWVGVHDGWGEFDTARVRQLRRESRDPTDV